MDAGSGAYKAQVVGCLLSVGGTHPKTETRPAGKVRTAIADAIKELPRDPAADDASFVALQNMIEQCGNASRC